LNEEPLPTHPHLRAAISGTDSLTLIPWGFRLKSTGQLAAEQGDDQTQFADLYLIGPPGAREVIVAHDRPEVLSNRARSALLDWAALVGHRRIWLPQEVVDLPSAFSPIEAASTECAVCGIRLCAGGFGFWMAVRSTGWFPNRCSACGGHLAQWRLASADPKGGVAR
jgi:hypothetical protein